MLEEKLLRDWIEYLIRRYNTNIQPSTDSSNIQRIAKKSRMSTSTTPILRNGNIAPLPIYPILFNPYYHPTIYSSYIPLSYGTRLIPVSEVPYPQQVFLNNKSLHKTTHTPEITTSNSLNNYSKIKKPVNVHSYFPPNNQDNIQKYENPIQNIPELIPIDSKKIIFGQNHSDNFDNTQPIEVHNEENENPDLARDKKLLNDADNFPNLIKIVPIQTNELQKPQHQLSSTTFTESSTPIYNINLSTINKTSTPITKSDILNSPDIFGNSVSQNPFDTNIDLSDKLSKRTQFVFKQSSLQDSHFLSVSELPKTMTDTKLVTTNSNNPENMLTFEDIKQLNEPRNTQPFLQASFVKNSIDILESSTEPKGVLKEITKTPLNLETMLSKSQHPTTELIFTSPCTINDDCMLKSPHITIPNIKTTFHTDSLNRSDKIKSLSSTTVERNEYYNQSGSIISSTQPSSISTTVSESMTMPYETLKYSIIEPTSPPSYESFTLSTSSNLLLTSDKNNDNQSINLLYTSLFPTLKHINSNITTTSMLIENKTEQSPANTINNDNYTINIKQNSNIPMYYEKSISSLTSTETSVMTQNTIQNALETPRNNVPSVINLSYINYPRQEHPIIEKLNNMYLDNKTNNNSLILTQNKTELTPSITKNYNNYSNNITQNTHFPKYYNKSIIPSSTTETSIQSVVTQNTIIQNTIEISNTNLPSNINASSISYPIQVNFTTEKTNIYLNDNTSNNIPLTTKGMQRSTLKSIMMPIKPDNSIQRKAPLITNSNDMKYKKSSNNRDQYLTKTGIPQTYKNSELWYNDMYTQSPNKKELNEKQIDYLLKKMIKLLKPEIEKQIITKETTSKLVTPKLGDQEKIVNIILPENIILPSYFTDVAKNMENEERLNNNKGLLEISDKI